MNARRLTLATLVALCVVAVWSAAPAVATVTEFGLEGEGTAELREVRGVAVDQESGDVYVVDSFNNRISKFGAEGQFLLDWGWGVADGQDSFQTCSAKCLPGIPGAGAGQLSGPRSIAVDQTGLSHDVYVMDDESARVEKYSPTGEFELMIGKGVNATTSGDVCLSGESCQAGEPGSEAGAFEIAESSDYLAVSASGELYVGDANRVQKFNRAGAFVGQITLKGIGSITSLAVAPSGGVYVEASEIGGVHEYAPCPATCEGVEVGEPRDAGGLPPGSSDTITVGPAGELYVEDASEGHHILAYTAAGAQTASFDAGGESAFDGLAFNDTNERLYAAQKSTIRLVSVPPPGPLVVAGTAEDREVLPSSAMVSELVNPEGSAGLSYRFEYGATEAYGASSAVESASGEGFRDERIGTVITGLQPAHVYHYRPVVTNAKGETTIGEDATFTTLPAVPISNTSASDVTSTSAKLAADIDPLGQEAKYHFEYGTSTSYGTSAPSPDASAGSGSSSVTKALIVEGLQSETTYHFRVVARSAAGVTEGADRVFVTQAAATGALADGREWEMVSPPEKHGVSFESMSFEGGMIQAAEGGEAFAYFANGPITTDPKGNRSIADSQLLAQRGPAGWGTQDISTPHEAVAGLVGGNLSEYKMFSLDLSVALVEPEGSTPLGTELEQPDGAERTPYRRDASGAFTPLVTAQNVPSGTHFSGTEVEGVSAGGVRVVSATPDLSHVIVASPQDLDPTRSFEGNGKKSLYEWVGGKLRLVSILPGNIVAAEAGDDAGLGLENRLVRGAVSTSGEVVFFGTESVEGAHLYVRNVARGETAQIDLPEAGVPVPEGLSLGRPSFQGASADGSRVYFSDPQRLTEDARARLTTPDLYTCKVGIVEGHVVCGGLKDLSVPLGTKEFGDVRGKLLAIDESGSEAYFMANGKLAPGAVAGDCEGNVYHTNVLPPRGQRCGLYRYSAKTGEVSLVATLSDRDAPEWEAAGGGDLGTTTARVSNDGRYFAFMSQEPLTGYDNHDTRTGEPDEEVFLYDADAGSLRCVSCAASGARPTGVFDPNEHPGLLVDRPGIWSEGPVDPGATVPPGNAQVLAGSIPGWTRANVVSALYPSRVLSNDGRMFFNSATPLVPQDTNGKEDVYEYEPSGVGSCGEPSGCVNLMSRGTSSEESAFLDASGEGKDVFFLTAARLSPSDTDSAGDVYDAHVCSASAPCPGVVAPVVPPSCSTSASCRTASAAQPEIFGPQPSATFSGSGNAGVSVPVAKAKAKSKVVKCKRGFVKKRNKCTKNKKPKKSKRAMRSNRRAR
jgi:hypothetical protein